jgi:hypothetical protein
MPYSGDEIRSLAISLLRQRTERDKQTKVGASNLSNFCDWHLASALRHDPQKPSYVEYGDDERAWLGGVIGTAIHGLLESRESDDDFIVEQALKIGDLDGYGDIWSKPDLYIASGHHLVDWKTSKRDRTKAMRQLLGQADFKLTSSEKLEGARLKLEMYKRQTHLYAKGLIDAGMPVERISIAFINRDATGWFDASEWADEYSDPSKNRDVWEWTFDYDAEYAEATWAHIRGIWAKVQNGDRDFERHRYCYPCQKSGAQLGTPETNFIVPWDAA